MPTPGPASRPTRGIAIPGEQFTIGRFTDNELILFDEQARVSWIVYPPRSGYQFLRLRRASSSVTLVEHHPWEPLVEPRDHQVDPRDACLEHGPACAANQAIKAAVHIGYNPFA